MKEIPDTFTITITEKQLLDSIEESNRRRYNNSCISETCALSTCATEQLGIPVWTGWTELTDSERHEKWITKDADEVVKAFDNCYFHEDAFNLLKWMIGKSITYTKVK